MPVEESDSLEKARELLADANETKEVFVLIATLALTNLCDEVAMYRTLCVCKPAKENK